MPSVDPSLVDPCIFWFWNATPTHAEIDARLDAFLAKGFRGVYVHPMPQSFRPSDFHGGMGVEYLSHEFFELITYTCTALAQRNMIMWLYDEGGWPSGMAGGRVVRKNPDFGIWVLEQVGDSVKPAQLIHEISYPDLMNPAATDCFIHHTHEAYRKYIESEFGRTVRGIFTDEARLIGRLGTSRIPWSPLLPEAFRTDHGYELAGVQNELFLPVGGNPERRRIHQDYRRTMSRLIARNYYQRISNWCAQHHLLFEGHHSGEDDFASHGQFFGNYLEQARHYHIPGADTIWRQIFPGQSGGNYTQLASSAAWLKEDRVAVSESFAVYGAGLTLEQMKWIAAFQLVRGVNKIGAMASLHSTQGGRRISVCSEISPKNPIWRDVDLWCEFVRNSARFTLKGEPIIRAAVLYRDELVAEDGRAKFNQHHEQICDWLHDQLVGWMFAGCEDLPRLAVNVLVVHIDASLDESEIEAIISAAQRGMRIIWCGESNPPDELRSRVEVHSVEKLFEINLRHLSEMKTDRPLNDVRLLSLSDGAWRGYLLFNQGDEPASFELSSRDGSPLQVHPLDAQLPDAWIDRAPTGANRITLAPGEMRAYESGASAQSGLLEGEAIPLTHGWTVARLESFEIDDDIAVRPMTEKQSETTLEDLSSRYASFSGSVVYEVSFTLTDRSPDEEVVLDLGAVYYSAEVWCNDAPAGRRAWQPFWFSLTHQIQPGSNTLRIRVTNTLANQWASPDVRQRDQMNWANMYLEKVSQYIDQSLHLGIMGPVVIRIFRRQPTEPTI